MSTNTADMTTQTRKTVVKFVFPQEMSDYEYIPCSLADIPGNVVWSTPRQNQGQIVEINYGHVGRDEACKGSPWMSRCDRSIGSKAVEYYRLVRKIK